MLNSTSPILGAHNALTFSKPMYPWGWLSIPFSRCQNHTVAWLLSNGVRCFDIRVSFNRKGYGYIRARHGMTVYKADVYNELYFLNSITTATPIYIRLILEKQYCDKDVERFQSLCDHCQRYFPNLIYFAGVRKSDWQLLYDFESGITESDVVQYVSSMADDARWYEKICPWLYAKRMNPTNKLQATEAGKIYLFDYL